MTPKQFLEKAIEGGWGKNKKEVELDLFNGDYTFLFDPKAWEAVAKVEGWGKEKNPYKVTSILHKHKGELCGKVFCETVGVKYKRDKYLLNMHRMIDFVYEGKTIEGFLKTLSNLTKPTGINI
jgi:hypothetical protein|tara:strand:- start:2632 stop:3000 length:369 start_codon:yes stop_codon:yes gene_type:complete